MADPCRKLGKLKKTFLKCCGTEHTYQISRKSDNISSRGILWGDSPPRGKTGGIFPRRAKSMLQYCLQRTYKLQRTNCREQIAQYFMILEFLEGMGHIKFHNNRTRFLDVRIWRGIPPPWGERGAILENKQKLFLSIEAMYIHIKFRGRSKIL